MAHITPPPHQDILTKWQEINTYCVAIQKTLHGADYCRDDGVLWFTNSTLTGSINTRKLLINIEDTDNVDRLLYEAHTAAGPTIAYS